MLLLRQAFAIPLRTSFVDILLWVDDTRRKRDLSTVFSVFVGMRRFLVQSASEMLNLLIIFMRNPY